MVHRYTIEDQTDVISRFMFYKPTDFYAKYCTDLLCIHIGTTAQKHTDNGKLV